MCSRTYEVNPAPRDHHRTITSITTSLIILISFTLYLLDQGTDALTSLLYFLDVRRKGNNVVMIEIFSWQGHYVEGSLTALLILAPGVGSCLLELRHMWRGHGNCGLALLYLLLCPLSALMTHLYSIFNPSWRNRAILLKTMEGFLCSGPQLVLQLALWFRGTLTSPLQLVLADHIGHDHDNIDTIQNMTVR